MLDELCFTLTRPMKLDSKQVYFLCTEVRLIVRLDIMKKLILMRIERSRIMKKMFKPYWLRLKLSTIKDPLNMPSSIFSGESVLTIDYYALIRRFFRFVILTVFYSFVDFCRFCQFCDYVCRKRRFCQFYSCQLGGRFSDFVNFTILSISILLSICQFCQIL